MRGSSSCWAAVQRAGASTPPLVRVPGWSRPLWEALLCAAAISGSQVFAERIYENRRTPVADPRPILADFPEFVQPVDDAGRFESPMLIDDEGADLDVRAWRYSYNARGIIEIPNRLRGAKTAVITVHPWGIDDGQGWKTPQPAGVAFACTPAKNKWMLAHARRVINPFLKSMRSRVGLVAYSLPGKEDPIRKKLYRSIRGRPSDADRSEGARQLRQKLASFDYRGGPLPDRIPLSSSHPAIDYFKHFPGLDAGDHFNGEGFWQLPIPIMEPIEVAADDVVYYDAEGYDGLRDFLKAQEIEHVLLCGYHADMCVCSTTAGYENLRRDFNVFLVGDAVQATLPANRTSRFATNQTVSYASLKLLITQVSWVRPLDELEEQARVTRR